MNASAVHSHALDVWEGDWQKLRAASHARAAYVPQALLHGVVLAQ